MLARGAQEGIWNPKSWRLASRVKSGGPFPGYLAHGLPPGCSEDSPTPSPTPPCPAMKEPPLEPGQTWPEDGQERGRSAQHRGDLCAAGEGGRRPVLGRGSRSQGGRREPRLNRARCPDGGLSRSGLRRGVCSSWPGSGVRGEWALPPWVSSSSQRRLVTPQPRPGSEEASPAGQSSVSHWTCQDFLAGPLALGSPPRLTFSGERPLAGTSGPGLSCAPHLAPAASFDKTEEKPPTGLLALKDPVFCP